MIKIKTIRLQILVYYDNNNNNDKTKKMKLKNFSNFVYLLLNSYNCCNSLT